MTTMTHEQARELFEHSISEAVFFDKLKDLGITIAEPEPPEAMVKLAREIAANKFGFDEDRSTYLSGAWDDTPEVMCALATLQHAVKVVRDAPKWPSDNPQTTAEFEAQALSFYGGRAVPEVWIIRKLGAPE